MAIPKIIHFTWKAKKLTRFAQRIWDEWARTHPDWELKLYDDEDIRALVSEHYPQQLAVFDSYPSGIFRADAFRFFVLHKFGGIYADLDMLPVRDISELAVRSECFVGAEPEKHVRENDALFRGMPFLLCNAFMGSVPGHPFWLRCIEQLENCFCPDVIDATGPRFLSGVALRLPRSERPDVLLPNYWSPLAGNGRPWPTNADYVAAIEQYFTVVGKDEPTLVSHLWRNSWFMPFPYKGPSFWRIPNEIQWAWRRLSNAKVAGTAFKAPVREYANQELIDGSNTPNVFVGVTLKFVTDDDDPVAVLSALDYPKSKFTIGLFGGDGATSDRIAEALASGGFSVVIHAENSSAASIHNAMLEAAQPFDFLLIVDGRISSVPNSLIVDVLSSGRPVTTVSVVGPDRSSRNESTFLYHKYVFKYLYRNGARDGAVRPSEGPNRLPLRYTKCLNVSPMTGVGGDLVLINKAVWEAGVRFAEVPYKYHTDTEGFAIAARDQGFEVCGLPNVEVVTRRPALA